MGHLDFKAQRARKFIGLHFRKKSRSATGLGEFESNRGLINIFIYSRYK